MPKEHRELFGKCPKSIEDLLTNITKYCIRDTGKCPIKVETH
jgi:hypothetical protein